MPKDKTAKEAEEAAGIGDNSDAVPFDMPREDFFAFYRRHFEIEAENDAVKAKRKKLTGELKSRGIKATDWKTFMRFDKLTPEERGYFDLMRKRFEDYLGRKPGEQFTMDFDDDDLSDEEREEQLVGKAYQDGFEEGVKGVKDEFDNPHAENSPAGQAWIKGYREGQQVAVRRLGELDRAADEREAEEDRTTERDFDDDDFQDDGDAEAPEAA